MPQVLVRARVSVQLPREKGSSPQGQDWEQPVVQPSKVQRVLVQQGD